MTPFELYEGLKNIDNAAILHAKKKVYPQILDYCKLFRLPAAPQQAEEITNDSLVELLARITDGRFSFQQVSPVAYCVKIGWYFVRNLAREKGNRLIYKVIDVLLPLSSGEDIIQNVHNMLYTKHLFLQLGERCARLIKLKYMDGYEYEEIIEQQLTDYKSKASLTNETTKCMKRLKDLAKQNNELSF